jgi:hypothetical protein
LIVLRESRNVTSKESERSSIFRILIPTYSPSCNSGYHLDSSLGVPVRCQIGQVPSIFCYSSLAPSTFGNSTSYGKQDLGRSMSGRGIKRHAQLYAAANKSVGAYPAEGNLSCRLGPLPFGQLAKVLPSDHSCPFACFFLLVASSLRRNRLYNTPLEIYTVSHDQDPSRT